MVRQDSHSHAAVVLNWPTVSMIQLPFASSLHLCEDDLPAVGEFGFPPKSGPDPIIITNHMQAVKVHPSIYLVCDT